MATKVELLTRMWNARVQHGETGHLPMQFDMDRSLQTGGVEREVETGRTTGTKARYLTKMAQLGGVIPYYTFDCFILYSQPNQAVVMRALVAGNGALTVTPTMAHAFVIMSSGEFRVAPPMGMTGRLNHAHIADMAEDVLFAGTISFGALGTRRGVLDWWNNDSGAYRCPATSAALAGLPMERFNTPRWAGLVGPVGPAPAYA